MANIQKMNFTLIFNLHCFIFSQHYVYKSKVFHLVFILCSQSTKFTTISSTNIADNHDKNVLVLVVVQLLIFELCGNAIAMACSVHAWC